MTRRDGLKMLASLGVLSFVPAAKASGAGALFVVFDGRFERSRRFAQATLHPHDCALDAAALWYRHLARQVEPNCRIEGLTTGADAMVLADCARKAGLAPGRIPQSETIHGLIRWSLRPSGEWS